MSYYHFPTSTERGPRRWEIKLSDGRRLSPDPDQGWTLGELVDCGFGVVVRTSQPAETATTTYDRSIVVVNGVATETWTARTKSAELQAREAAEATVRTTVGTLETQARAAVDANRTYLAIANPNNAQIAAQVRLLTRECSALIRLLVARDALDATVD